MMGEKEINILVDILTRVELISDEEKKVREKLELLQKRINTVKILQGIDSDLDKLDTPIEK